LEGFRQPSASRKVGGKSIARPRDEKSQGGKIADKMGANVEKWRKPVYEMLRFVKQDTAEIDPN